MKLIKTVKSEKVTKITKSRKHKKWQNHKIRKVKKVIKWKSLKSDKKSVKNRPPPKMAKMSLKWPKSTLCVFRAAWSGTFWVPGGTTGPGFKAEIDTPPSRRRIFTHVLHFITFTHLSFSCFSPFYDVHVLCILVKCAFLLLHCNKALRVIRGDV